MIENLYNSIYKLIPLDEKEKNDKEIMLEYIKTEKDVLTRENKIAHFTASAWIVNKSRTKVLMAYHNIYNSWAWIGGHADGDEDLFRVICREINEETGLNVFHKLYDGVYGVNILTVESHIKRNKVVSSHLHLDVEYVFEADENETLHIKEDENSGVKWINIDEIDKYVSEENIKPIYNRLNQKLALIK